MLYALGKVYKQREMLLSGAGKTETCASLVNVTLMVSNFIKISTSSILDHKTSLSYLVYLEGLCVISIFQHFSFCFSILNPLPITIKYDNLYTVANNFFFCHLCVKESSK